MVTYYPAPASAGLSAYSLEALIVIGAAQVLAGVFPPGLRVPIAGTLTEVHLIAGTAPTGAALNVGTHLNGVLKAALSPGLPAGTTRTDITGLAQAVAVGDVFTFDVSQVGSIVTGSDLLVQFLIQP